MFRLDRNVEWSAALVAILLAVALFPPGTAPVAAESPTVATPSDQPAFHQDRITENRGDVATVGVDVGDLSNATLRIEPANESASEYTAEVTVHDRNVDGQVAVQFNTYAMGHDASPVSASGSDTVHVRQSADLDHRLRVGEYRLTLEAGNETVAESTLVVQPATFEELRVLTANGTQPANLSTQAGVETAIENGTFDDHSKFSTRDTLLIELEASGLSGPLASQSGPNVTARFLNLFDGPGFSFTIQESYKSIDTEEAPAGFTPTPAATTVVADSANDTYYLLLNAARMPHHERGKPNEITRVEEGDVFDVNVTVTDSSGIYDGRQSRTSQLTYLAWVTAETPITVDAAANQTIEMDSNLVYTSLDVVLRSDDGWSQSAHTIELEDDGTLVATFDLSDRSPGETLTLVVERRGLGVFYSEQDAVNVQSPTLTPSPTETLTPTPTPTQTPTATAPDPTERTPTETPESTPGFGPIAALVGLVLALLATGRRRR